MLLLLLLALALFLMFVNLGHIIIVIVLMTEPEYMLAPFSLPASVCLSCCVVTLNFILLYNVGFHIYIA